MGGEPPSLPHTPSPAVWHIHKSNPKSQRDAAPTWRSVSLPRCSPMTLSCRPIWTFFHLPARAARGPVWELTVSAAASNRFQVAAHNAPSPPCSRHGKATQPSGWLSPCSQGRQPAAPQAASQPAAPLTPELKGEAGQAVLVAVAPLKLGAQRGNLQRVWDNKFLNQY